LHMRPASRLPVVAVTRRLPGAAALGDVSGSAAFGRVPPRVEGRSSLPPRVGGRPSLLCDGEGQLGASVSTTLRRPATTGKLLKVPGGVPLPRRASAILPHEAALVDPPQGGFSVEWPCVGDIEHVMLVWNHRLPAKLSRSKEACPRGVGPSEGVGGCDPVPPRFALLPLTMPSGEVGDGPMPLGELCRSKFTSLRVSEPLLLLCNKQFGEACDHATRRPHKPRLAQRVTWATGRDKLWQACSQRAVQRI